MGEGGNRWQGTGTLSFELRFDTTELRLGQGLGKPQNAPNKCGILARHSAVDFSANESLSPKEVDPARCRLDSGMQTSFPLVGGLGSWGIS